MHVHVIFMFVVMKTKFEFVSPPRNTSICKNLMSGYSFGEHKSNSILLHSGLSVHEDVLRQTTLVLEIIH